MKMEKSVKKQQIDSKAAVVKSTKALTHKDIKELLEKFAEAILVDQERVNKLPLKKFHPNYDHGWWQSNREDSISAIVDLSLTVDKMPKRLLKKLTDLAIAYNPEVVKVLLLNRIIDQAASPRLYETAALFFSDLIEDVSQQGKGVNRTGSPIEMMLGWFDYDDPIKIAEDCGYVDLLDSHIERESEAKRRVLAAQSRLSFIEMQLSIGGIEMCDVALVQEGLRARSGRKLS